MSEVRCCQLYEVPAFEGKTSSISVLSSLPAHLSYAAWPPLQECQYSFKAIDP